MVIKSVYHTLSLVTLHFTVFPDHEHYDNCIKCIFFTNQSKSHRYHMIIMHTANRLYNWQILELNKQSPN